jgi:hypothetical protein
MDGDGWMIGSFWFVGVERRAAAWSGAPLRSKGMEAEDPVARVRTLLYRRFRVGCQNSQVA